MYPREAIDFERHPIKAYPGGHAVTHKSLTEKAAEPFMDQTFPKDDKPQGLLEYEECLRALREQLEARVKAAGEVG